MSEATYVPILPDMSTFFKETTKGSKQAGEQAGRDFASGMEREIKRAEKAVEAASKAQERAAERATDATAKRRLEEQKLAEVLEKGNAKQSEILAATNRYEKAQRDETASKKAAEKATSDLASKQADLAKQTEEASSALEVAGHKGEGFNISMKDAALGATAMAAAAGGVVAGLVSIGSTFDDAYDSIRIGTGASGEAFEGLKDSMKKVATESIGVGSDMGAIGTTVADLNTRLGLTGKPLEDVSAQFLQLQKMGIDADINDVSGAFNQFNVSAEDAPANMDMLFRISQATGRTITELTGNLSKSGPALQEFGFGLEESAGLLGALDKAGLDSEKTVGSMTKALSEFAKDGKDPQQALWGTITKIEDLKAAGKDMEAVDLANSIFGAKGGAGFVAAVESGQFAYDDFLDSIGASGDTISGLAAETADFAESWDQFKNKALVAIEPLATELFNKLAPAIDIAAEKFEELVGWVEENKDLVTAIVVGVGSAATAFMVWRGALIAVAGAQKAFAVATTIANGGMKALNATMRANVIGLIVTAIAGLVAGLVYFFTKTETGQKMWETFTKALATGWDWVKGVFTAGWEIIKTVVFGGWEWYTNRVKANWEIITGVISAVWTWLKDSLVNGWNTIKALVFDAWTWYVDRVKANWEMVTGFISGAWNWLKDTLIAGWELIKLGVFMAWDATVEYVRGQFEVVTGAISGSWQWLSDRMSSIWSWIKTNVFDSMTASLDVVKGWFSSTVDNIGTAWDKLRALTARPVRFVVETVYGGIRNAWNKVAGLVGLGELPEVGLGSLGAYAKGGVLPGYTPGRDVHEFFSPTGGRIHLSGGEAIMRPEWVRAIGGPSAVDEMNRAARTGKGLAAKAHDHYALGGIWDVGAFAGGGTLRKNPGVVLTTDIQRSMERAVAAAFPNQIITSATRYQDVGSGFDNHMAGRALDFGASHALADWIARTYPNSAELFWDPGPNIKNGSPTGAIGGHSDHVHWAMASMVDPYTGEVVSQDGPGGGGVSLLGMAKGLWDKAIGAIGKFPDADTMGTIGKLPGAALSTLANGAWNFLQQKLSSVGSFFGGGGGGEQYRGQIEAAFRNQGETPRKDLVDALVRQINSESGGDPNIAQQIVDVNGTGPSAGLGLYQFIPGTFAAYRDPSLPNDRTDPWAAHNAAVRYFRDRHGWNTGPGGVGRGHGWKTGGVLPTDLTTLFDTGGVWKSGTAGVNLSGADEYVFTNRAMRDFQLATESLAVVSKELKSAYEGDNWGHGELARILGNEEWAKAIIRGASQLGEIHRAMDAGFAAAQQVWAEQAPGQDDWIQAGWEFLGMGDSLTAGLIARGKEFNDLVGKYEEEQAKKDDEAITVDDPIIVDPPDIPAPPPPSDPPGDSAGGVTAVGADGLTVVINLDGVEVLRQRVENVEGDVVEIDKELEELKSERRGVDAASKVLLS